MHVLCVNTNRHHAYTDIQTDTHTQGEGEGNGDSCVSSDHSYSPSMGLQLDGIAHTHKMYTHIQQRSLVSSTKLCMIPVNKYVSKTNGIVF